MRILFLSNRIPYPIKDGQSRRTYNILKGLAKRHDVHLLSLYEGIEEIDPHVIEHLGSFCKTVETQRAPSKALSFSMVIRLLRSLISKDPYTIWRHYSGPYMHRVHELAKNSNFDLIHCDILPLSYTVRKLSSPPCAITDHDVSYLKTLRMAKQARNPLLKVFLLLETLKLKRLESEVFSQVDMGIVVSEVDRKFLQDLCPNGKFHVIENGVDTEEFKPSTEEPDTNSLIWVGGFGHYPNKEAIHYFLQEIYPIVKRQVPDVTLILIGEGINDGLSQFHRADPSINIIGYVDDPLPYIQSATVFIAPILSGSGTRLKLLEAMAAAKAIVTTTVGCEGIEGADSEHYFIVDQPGDFSRRVLQALENLPLRESLGLNARKFVQERYEWKSISEKLDFAYRSLVHDT